MLAEENASLLSQTETFQSIGGSERSIEYGISFLISRQPQYDQLDDVWERAAWDDVALMKLHEGLEKVDENIWIPAG